MPDTHEPLRAEMALSQLVDAARATIADKVDGRSGRAEVLDGLDAVDFRAIQLPAPREIPACHHLSRAIEEVWRAGFGRLARAVEAARPFLAWTTYDAYRPEEIGQRFAATHAFAEIVGPGATFEAADYDLGLFLIGPHVLYRDHHHPAPELYLPLTGPTRWRFGTGAPWESRRAGETVWNVANRVHATIVDEKPLLCLYAWTKDVSLPALVDKAADWTTIDAALAAKAKDA